MRRNLNFAMCVYNGTIHTHICKRGNLMNLHFLVGDLSNVILFNNYNSRYYVTYFHTMANEGVIFGKVKKRENMNRVLLLLLLGVNN